MKILTVGGGGREHAIITKFAQSEKKPELYSVPGNGGIADTAKCFPYKATDIDNILKIVKENNIDLVFVASDDPLAAGLVDEVEKIGVRAFGPRKNAAELEWSKVFSKNLMKKYNIPTAQYETFDNAADAKKHLENAKYPLFIKVDGLALGKGAVFANDYNEAAGIVREMLEDKKFGDSGNRIVIEEELIGFEVTVLAFADGKTVKPMVVSKDHKRIGDGDTGLNTGGMGAISPVPEYTDEYAKMSLERVFIPTIKAMEAEGRIFKGVIYFGLMLTKNGPYVIEYNARFGDPEAQVVLPRLRTDLIDIADAVIDGTLDTLDIEWYENAAAGVVFASGGYPEKYETGFEISGISEAEKSGDVKVYHAGTKKSDGKYLTSGGRVVCVTAVAENLDAALDKAYKAGEKIDFKDKYYRKDIGKTKNRLLE